MKKNMGSLDRVLRIIAGVVFAILIVTQTVSGVLAVILGILAVVFIVTSLIGVCPGYVPFRWSTLPKARTGDTPKD